VHQVDSEEEHLHDWQVIHQGCVWHLVAVMPRVGELVWHLYYFGVAALLGSVLGVVDLARSALFDASLLAVAYDAYLAYVVLLSRAHVLVRAPMDHEEVGSSSRSPRNCSMENEVTAAQIEYHTVCTAQVSYMT